MFKALKTNFLQIITLFLSGVIMTLSFAPFRMDLLAIVSLAIFFYYLGQSKSLVKSYLFAVIFGLGFFSTSLYWVAISISLYTESLAIGIATVSALILTLCLTFHGLFAVFATLFSKHNKEPLLKVIVFPALWVINEILRGLFILGGFPWVYVGYSQTESPLLAYAPMGGVYLISYIVALIAAFIAFFIFTKPKLFKLKYAVVSIFLIYAVAWYYHEFLPSWTPIKGKSQPVLLVQSNFVKGDKWNNNNLLNIQNYVTNIVRNNQNRMIFLSENSIPVFKNNYLNYFDTLDYIAKQNNDSLMIGSLDNKEQDVYYNAATIEGIGSGSYYKHHLVPFGEYFPIISSFKYANDLIGLASFTAGNEVQKPLKMFDNNVSTFICYEIAYAQQVHKNIQNTYFIATITDDSWFGDSIAAYQHLQIDQMRAVENGKYIVQASNNGITAIVKPDGQVQKQLPRNVQGTLYGNVYKTSGYTLWTKYGMNVIYGGLLASLLLILAIRLNPKNIKSKKVKKEEEIQKNIFEEK